MEFFIKKKFKGFEDEIYDISKSTNELPFLFKMNSKFYMNKAKVSF